MQHANSDQNQKINERCSWWIVEQQFNKIQNVRHSKTQHRKRIESYVNRHRDKRKATTNYDELECFKKLYSDTICKLLRIIHTTKERCISIVKSRRHSIKWRINERKNNDTTENLRCYETNNSRYCRSNQLRCHFRDIMITTNEFTNWLNEEYADFKKLTDYQKNFAF